MKCDILSNQPCSFHMMAKPTGARCNLHCRYCFFLAKEKLYSGRTFRMDDVVLESYIRQMFTAHAGPVVEFTWQGGEPTLMGLEFYRRVIQLQRKYVLPGISFHNSLQTNGIVLDDAWCQFLREHDFLVGLSLDGPRQIHDAFRVDKSGKGTFDRVLNAASLLRKHAVDFNVLATVHSISSKHPLEVYRFLRDTAGTQFLQFIPIVERSGDGTTSETVDSAAYGRFLSTIFDEWVHKDVGKVFVQAFDAALASWVGAPAGLCVFAATCGSSMALEHNGDVYSCDHFVDEKHRLGNILQKPLAEMVTSPQQRQFGLDKSQTLPSTCNQCRYLFACRGDCPKNRFVQLPDGQSVSYLCTGLRMFFQHIDTPMQIMAELLRHQQSPADIMSILAVQQQEQGSVGGGPAATAPGRNDRCPCGSGRKFKQCHGRHG